MGKVDTPAHGGYALFEGSKVEDEVGVDVEEHPTAPAQAVEALLADPGFVEFALAGTEVAGEFRCADCGYGVVVHRSLPHCPMCGGSVWEKRDAIAPRVVD